MSRMERGAEHALRSELARMSDRDVLKALASTRSEGDKAAQAVIEDEMDRRGLRD